METKPQPEQAQDRTLLALAPSGADYRRIDSACDKGSTLSLSSQFTLVFFSVLGLTVLCLLLSVYVSSHLDAGASNVEAMKSLNEKLLSMSTLGCGAIIGMLGRKTSR